MEKICKICNEVKPIEQFHIAKNSGGYVYRKGFCIECERTKNREYYPKRNKEYEKNRHKKFHETHPDWNKNYHQEHKTLKLTINKICPNCGMMFKTKLDYQIRCKKDCKPQTEHWKVQRYLKEHPDINREEYFKEKNKNKFNVKYRKAYLENNPDKKKAYDLKRTATRKAYKQEHLIEFRAKKQAYKKNRMAIDIDYKLKETITNKVRQSIMGNKLYNHSIDLLGCSIIDVRRHIESQFKEGMTWDNWGIFGWHIDHIIPIASFDFTKKEDQYRCFNYTNLQPLWWYDNVMKRDKIETKQLILL